jgi:hypothetical protein
MKIGTKLLAVVLASGLLVAVIATNLQHVYAQIDPGNFVLWKKTTHEFEKNVINAIGDPGLSPGPRELLSAYVDDVNRIFLGGPVTIPGLLEQYQLAVSAVLSQPPEPDKQAQHDQIKEFRQLTHAFEKAVIGAVSPPEPE